MLSRPSSIEISICSSGGKRKALVTHVRNHTTVKGRTPIEIRLVVVRSPPPRVTWGARIGMCWFPRPLSRCWMLSLLLCICGCFSAAAEFGDLVLQYAWRSWKSNNGVATVLTAVIVEWEGGVIARGDGKIDRLQWPRPQTISSRHVVRVSR
jgi:hypothetical protein